MKLRIAFALLLSAVVAPVLVPTPASAGTVPPAPPTAVATFARTAQWATGYVGSYTVRNDSAVPLAGWRVEFDLAAGTRITSLWNGRLTRSGDRYAVTGEPWNGTLAPGASAGFGWVAEGTGTPAGCTLNGDRCDGTPPPPADRTAPTRPGPLTIAVTTDVRLRWGASTDDAGPVRYEIYESGRLLTTVTDTEYVYATGPALPPRIYVFFVRAVDAAGNASASVWQSIGRIWRGDEVPPAPTGLHGSEIPGGLVGLQWTAAEVPSQLTVPPVAGYRVTVDGATAGEVGGTSIVLPAWGPGPHTIEVRTINAVDQLSEPAVLTVG